MEKVPTKSTIKHIENENGFIAKTLIGYLKKRKKDTLYMLEA